MEFGPRALAAPAPMAKELTPIHASMKQRMHEITDRADSARR